ncbi:MAG: hypothetical protein HY270_13030, partial [Deltaproteobacteria bacterium]|nr:hypothetical protein [Deltaproteobacteria bacterium]
MRFFWSQSCASDNGAGGGDECAVRVGNALTFGGQTAGLYPGIGSRTQANDGHFVTVTLTSLCGDGVVQGSRGEDCDLGALNGTAGACCNANCTFKSAGTTCRGSAGGCDLVEACDGASATCPADAVASSGSVCRSAAGPCDAAEICNGVSPTCPTDIKKPSGTVCRGTAGVCDVAEVCDGSSNTCPADGFLANTTVCRSAAGQCDLAENCPGNGPNCPADGVKPNNTPCNDGSVCTQTDTCQGGTCTGSNPLTCDACQTCDAINGCSGAPCTVTPTETPTNTATLTFTNSPSPSLSPTPSLTSTRTATATRTATQTFTMTPTLPATPTATGLCVAAAPGNPCIPGGGKQSIDCALEWDFKPVPKLNLKGIPKTTAICYEGDTFCDMDANINNHSCTMIPRLCLNNSDPRTIGCFNTGIVSFEVKNPKATSLDPTDVTNLATLESQAGLGGWGLPIIRQKTPTPGVTLAAPNQCSNPLPIVVPQKVTASGKVRIGKRSIRIQVTDGFAQKDTDSLRLQCRPSTCGDNILQFDHEDCDDGNRLDGDGCDHGCRIEIMTATPTNTKTPTKTLTPTPTETNTPTETPT